MKFLLSLAILAVLTSAAHAQGSVTLRNLSWPFTPLEAGDWVQVAITGATPGGTVTSVQNGTAPYTWGTPVDGSGNWTVSAQETTANVGDYTQTWYVNGVALTPNNPPVLTYGPTLPNFSISTPTLPFDPAVRNFVDNACGGPTNVTPVWAWTPISYQVTSSYYDTGDAASEAWNSAQSIIAFQSSSAELDVLVGDGSLAAGTYAQAYAYSQGCSSCYGQVDACNNACLSPSTLWGVNITLDPSQIDTAAAAVGWNSTAFADQIAMHEFGHALGLDHEPIESGACSQIDSIVAPGGLGLLCGYQAPTARDVRVVTNSLYPYSPGYCAPGNNVCYGLSCQ